jgi:sigma-B regulation protein RsbU (phosphoserine phosphatase)
MSDKQGKPVVLAVDDTPENLDVVKGILASDYIVKAAINGKMALKIAEKQPPDLILLDIMMPEMDGYEVCTHLKSNPITREIPVIFLTAKDQTTDEAKGFELGAADYILKPVNPPILEARVRTHIALKKSMDELQSAYAIIKKHKERMEEELNVAQGIQMSMVPLDFPAFPEREEFDVRALLKPAREVGGDFYDFYFTNDKELCFCVGDVSGKGVPAALFMAVTQTLIKARATDDPSPASIITRVNEEMAADNPSCMFVTLFLGILNIETGELRFTNAGHNPPHIKRANGELECLTQRHGPILAAVEGVAFKQDQAKMDKGDTLLVFTDGVTEAMDINGELYSDPRLEKLLQGQDFPSAEDMVDKTLASVEEFATGADQADDITIMALRYRQQPKQVDRRELIVEIRNDLAEIDRVNQEFNEFAEHNGMSPAISPKLNIAFDELLNNIISYGFEEGTEHQIRVTAEYVDPRLVVTVTDDGIPFNPFDKVGPDITLSIEEREIGGLGIHIVKKMMDSVSYKRHRECNVVTLTIDNNS